MCPRGDLAGKPHVAVQQPSHGIANRIVRIVGLDEHGIERGNAPLRAASGTFDELRQKCIYRRRKTSRRGRFAGGEADLALRQSESGQRVHDQEHVFALIAKVLGNRRGRRRGLHAHQRRLVAAGHDHNALGQPGGSQIAFDEFVDFPPALADQRDDVDVGRRVASHHAQENAFADARAGEDSHPLTFAAGQEPVDRTHAGRQGAIDPWPVARVRWRAVEGDAVVQGRTRMVVNHLAVGIDDSAQQLVAHAQPATGAHQPNATAPTHAAQIAQWIQERQVVAEADHLGQHRRARLTLDFGQRSDRRGKSGRRDGHSHRLRDAPGEGSRHHAIQLLDDLHDCKPPWHLTPTYRRRPNVLTRRRRRRRQLNATSSLFTPATSH